VKKKRQISLRNYDFFCLRAEEEMGLDRLPQIFGNAVSVPMQLQEEQR
jgi:hypothetical protein